MVVNPTRSQLNRENIFSLPLFPHENSVSRDGFVRPSRQFNHHFLRVYCTK